MLIMNSIFLKHGLSFKLIVLSSLPHKHTLDLKSLVSHNFQYNIFLIQNKKKIQFTKPSLSSPHNCMQSKP